jgi:hypothetical protein
MHHKAVSLLLSGVLAASGRALAADDFPKPTPEQRLDYIHRARVWEKTDVASKDIYAGPRGKLPFKPGDEVKCQFVLKQMTGWSEKFSCRLKDGNVIKVKYNGPSQYKETFGEVLGTRLLWALGFYADRMIPVEVVCEGCPEHPWDYVNYKKKVSGEGNTIEELPHDAMVGTYRFAQAAIEDPIDAATIEEEDKQGWDWKVLDEIDPKRGGATRAEVDALKLVNAFLQNADNKAAQNTLACPHNAISKDKSGATTCKRPILFVDDVGSVFGEGGFTTGGSGRIDFEGWKSREVWKDAKECRARLSAIGGPFRKSTLNDPVIGEKGRQLLAAQMSRLSDKQIADLFRVARVESLGLERNAGAAGDQPVTISDWVELFKAKRKEITEHPGCPTP